jgi:hypothetical protein
MRFLSEKFEKLYNKIKDSAESDMFAQPRFSEKELHEPFLDNLLDSTKSKRIERMLRLAYWLGWLRGIKYCDGMLNTELEPSLNKNMLEEACRQWCDFVDEAPERKDGKGFANFYKEILLESK